MAYSYRANSDKFLIAICCISCITLATAYAFEFIGGYIPCDLCSKQRLPYIIVIIMTALMIIGRVQGYSVKIILTISAVIMFGGMFLALYHAGIEWDFWEGPTSCTMIQNTLTTNILPDLTNINIVRCDEAPWRFAGLSFAGWNAIISLIIAIIALIGAQKGYVLRNQGSNSTSQ